MEQIRACARGSVDEIVCHASLTHSGPTYSAAPEAAKAAVPRVVGAIETAVRSLAPARIGVGQGQIYLGFNRRFVNTDGSMLMLWRNESMVSSTMPVDPTVGVIRVDRADGSPLAVLVHYS